MSISSHGTKAVKLDHNLTLLIVISVSRRRIIATKMRMAEQSD